MGEVFNQRIIISGFEVEHYAYLDKSIYRGYDGRSREKREAKIEEKVQTEKTKFSVNRTRTEIRRRINSNPHLIKFLTLTSTNTDIKTMNRNFNLFTQRMKDRFPEFLYLAVPEFQKDIDYFGRKKPGGGAVHYHLLCNLRFVRSKELEKIWGHGFIKIKRVDRVKNLGIYLCKYLNKDIFDKRMFRKKKYFCSQDLEKSLEIVGEKAKMFLEKSSHNLKFITEKQIQNDFIGGILYTLYHFTTLSLDLVWKENESGE